MTIKSDKWIAAHAAAGMITPYEPECIRSHIANVGQAPVPVVSYGMSSHGYDLRLDMSALKLLPKTNLILTPKSPPHRLEHVKLEMDQDNVPCWVLPDGRYALGITHEKICMERDVFGLVYGKSTYARLGIHVNCTPIESGWSGHISVGIANLSGSPVAIYPMEGFAQIVFFDAQDPVNNYAEKGGRYDEAEKSAQLPKVAA